tara:strand:- start:3324 stop:3611 length:288 start_codon:yes stop_codon:yes gene_type:complete
MNNFKQGTHKQILYDYLLKGKSVTTRSAMIELGLGDLQGTIRDLKKAGIDIITQEIKVPTRHNKPDGSIKHAHVKEYSLDVLGYKSAEEWAEWNV